MLRCQALQSSCDSASWNPYKNPCLIMMAAIRPQQARHSKVQGRKSGTVLFCILCRRTSKFRKKMIMKYLNLLYWGSFNLGEDRLLKNWYSSTQPRESFLWIRSYQNESPADSINVIFLAVKISGIFQKQQHIFSVTFSAAWISKAFSFLFTFMFS